MLVGLKFECKNPLLAPLVAKFSHIFGRHKTKNEFTHETERYRGFPKNAYRGRKVVITY